MINKQLEIFNPQNLPILKRKKVISEKQTIQNAYFDFFSDLYANIQNKKYKKEDEKEKVYFVTLTSRQYWYTAKAAIRAVEYFYSKFASSASIYVTESHKSGFKHVHGILVSNHDLIIIRKFTLKYFGRNRIVEIIENPTDKTKQFKTPKKAVSYVLKYIHKSRNDDYQDVWDIYLPLAKNNLYY